jgi:Uma2 family endonuclease
MEATTMSTIERSDRHVLPPLAAGQRLDQPTFHVRYQAMPPGVRSELVGGEVVMPSPLLNDHGEMDEHVGYWLSHFKRFTPGLRSPRNTSTILGRDSEVQPDCQLRIPQELGGQSRVIDGYVTGAPELVLEVSKASRSFDLGRKKDDYEKAGVLEYLVVTIEPDEVTWFVRRDGRFVPQAPGRDGLFRSEVFPGLWLDPAALFAGNLNGLSAALEQGLATPEHAAFAARLAAGAPPG